MTSSLRFSPPFWRAANGTNPKKRKIEKIIPFFLGGAANIDYIRF